MNKLTDGRRVGVIFGGRSVEHEVSIVTAHQGMDALKVAGFEILPMYISKLGYWYAGDGLYNLRAYADLSRDFAKLPGVSRVSLSPDRGIRRLLAGRDRRSLFRQPPPLWADVFFPMTHGSFGEDGTLAGLLELAGVPYVGAGVLASAIGVDKAMTKRVARASGVPVLDCLVLEREIIHTDPAAARAQIAAFAEMPVMVKPVHLGSSIGVRRCAGADELIEGLAVAATIDTHVLVEPALADFFEINCSVIGPPEEVSVCEQPKTDATVLSFEEKYQRGTKSSPGAPAAGMASLDRIIPAPIPDELTRVIQRLALTVFTTIGASGVARIDFLYDRTTSKLYFNEINTIPGSLAFYLWEATGLTFDELMSRLMGTALKRSRARDTTVFSFEANLLKTLS